MTAARNVYGNVYQYDAIADLDVYGNVREWEVVPVIAETPSGGWSVRSGERVWYPETSLVVFSVRKSDRVWVVK